MTSHCQRYFPSSSTAVAAPRAGFLQSSRVPFLVPTAADDSAERSASMERDPVDPRIEYEAFQGPCPSCAWGRFLGYRWEFYGRFDHWDFTLSTDPGVDPDGWTYRDMRPADMPACIFFRERQYCPEGEYRAGYIPNEEMRELVRRCILEFEQERGIKTAPDTGRLSRFPGSLFHLWPGQVSLTGRPSEPVGENMAGRTIIFRRGAGAWRGIQTRRSKPP